MPGWRLPGRLVVVLPADAEADTRDRLVRAGLVMEGDGELVSELRGAGVDEVTYRKIHLFDAFTTTESDTVAPGDEVVTADVDGWTVGLATCFDVRFPDQFTELGRRGSDLVVLPASWGDGPGKASQWDLLTRARAAARPGASAPLG